MDAFGGATGGVLNALSRSARAEYLSAETGGGGPLKDMGPPRVFLGPPRVLLAPAGIDIAPAGIDPEAVPWSLANASKLANPADVSATYNSIIIIIIMFITFIIH